jgi:hypothetical protein
MLEACGAFPFTQKALRGGIPGAVLEPLVRSWSHFVGIYRQKLTGLLKIDFSDTPTKDLALQCIETSEAAWACQKQFLAQTVLWLKVSRILGGSSAATGLRCGSRLRKGEVFAYVGRNQNLKDLTDLRCLRVRCPAAGFWGLGVGCRV